MRAKSLLSPLAAIKLGRDRLSCKSLTKAVFALVPWRELPKLLCICIMIFGVVSLAIAWRSSIVNSRLSYERSLAAPLVSRFPRDSVLEAPVLSLGFPEHCEKGPSSLSIQDMYAPALRRGVAYLNQTAYIAMNEHSFLVQRQPSEPQKQFPTSGITLKCGCYRGSAVKAPYCPCGFQCSRTFLQLDLIKQTRGFTKLADWVESPFPHLLNRENTKAGQKFEFVDAWRKPKEVTVNSTFIQALPRFGLPRHDRCAVVGQSAILKGSGYGTQIDSDYYGAVFRMNENAIDKFGYDIGTRADYWLTSGQYSPGRLEEIGIMERIRKTRATYLVLMNLEEDFDRFIIMRNAFPWVKMHPTHPQWWNWYGNYRLSLYPDIEDKSWEWHTMKGVHFGSMSGTMTAIIALQMCNHIDLYGFYGNYHSMDGQILPYHYDAHDHEYRGNLNVRTDFEFLSQLATFSTKEQSLRIFL